MVGSRSLLRNLPKAVETYGSEATLTQKNNEMNVPSLGALSDVRMPAHFKQNIFGYKPNFHLWGITAVW